MEKTFYSLSRAEKTHSIYNRLLAIEDKDPTLVYIQYMEFARRAEGIKSGRMIFKKAREDPRTRHHIYVTAALMEYYCSKDTSEAFEIFIILFPVQHKSFTQWSPKQPCTLSYIMGNIIYLNRIEFQ
eukprot:XP_012817646.1 PREDICTED: cleavage stimulation factor subunit 3-like isoform X2 [Xenopus tropicalis]